MGLVCAMCTNSKATPINNNDYTELPYNSCRTCLTNCMGSISCYITPLVINSLGGRDTYKHTYRHLHRNNFKKPGERWPQAGTHLDSPDLKTACKNPKAFMIRLC